MKVYTTIDAWNKMSYWAALGGRKGREFTCFGRAVHEDGDFRVTDVYLVKQEGTAGGVDGDDADINRLMVELYQKGIEPDEAFRCWIHSHPGTGPGATYLSGTDEENITRYLTGAFLISIVLDSKGDNPYCRIDIKEPRMSVKADLKVELPPMQAGLKKSCEEEFEEKSSARIWVPKHQNGRKGGAWPLHGDVYEDDYYGSVYGTALGSGYRGNHNYRSTGGGYVTQLDKEDASGKINGAALKGTNKNVGAVKEDKNIVHRPDYDSLSLYGDDTEEYEAWLEYLNQEELENERAGEPSSILHDDTELLTIHELEEESVPEWVVSMADEMGCDVSLLCQAINIKEYDNEIDEIVFQLQCGHKGLDECISALEDLGIEKSVAKRELMTRVNA